MTNSSDSQSGVPHELAHVQRLPLATLLSRAVRLRCPRCGSGKLFSGLFRMYRDCPNCKLVYEPAPGYYLGATYVNYGLTAVILTASYLGLFFLGGYDNRTLLWPLSSFIVLFPLLSFRHARAIWMAIDLFVDPAQSDTDQVPYNPDGEH